MRECVVAKRRSIDEHDRDVTLAWHIAVLVPHAFTKKGVPPLKKLLMSTAMRPMRQQSRAEQQAMFQMLAAQLKTVPRKTRLIHVESHGR